MKHLKEIGILLGVAAVSAGVSCFYVNHYGKNNVIIQETQQAPVQYSAYTKGGEPIDFTYAADQSVMPSFT